MPDPAVLTVMLLDPSHRDARAEAGDLHRMHARVAALTDGAGGRVLWSLPSPTFLAVQAARPVTAGDLPAGYARSVVHADQAARVKALHCGGRVAVTLVANPAKCVSASGPDGAMPRHGKRTPLRSEDERGAWLARKLGAAATVDEVTVTDLGTGSGRRDGTAVLIRRVRFDATLTVTDPGALATLVASGVGPAKGYGCGLLILGEAF